MVSTRRRTQAREQAETDNAAIHRLSDELLLSLFELLHATSKPSVLAATRVSRRWHVLAQRVIDSSVGPLAFGKQTEASNLNLFRRLNKDAAFRSRIHHLSISDWHLSDLDFETSNPYRPGGYFSEDWSEAARFSDQTWPQIDALIQVLPKLSLASFTWRALPFMPQPLTRVLEQQACKIFIQRNKASEYARWFYDAYVNPKGLQNLHGLAPNLVELDILMPAADDELLAKLGRLVHLASSLRKLRIYGASRMRIRKELPSELQMTRHAEFSTVEGLDWLRHGHTEMPHGRLQALRLSSLGLTNFCVCSSTAKQRGWIDAIEWNTIETLQITCAGMLRYVHGRLNSLKSLDVYLQSTNPECEHPMCSSVLGQLELRNILEGFTHLEYLGITNDTEIIQGALNVLPATMRSMDIHAITLAREVSPLRPILGTESLEFIGKTFKCLQHLGCDAPYSDKEYVNFLDHVTKAVRTLQSLKVYRETERNGTDRAVSPRSGVTLSSVSDDFRRVQRALPTLLEFSVFVESTASFDRDTVLNEWGFNHHLQEKRRFVISMGKDHPIVHCLEIGNLETAVSGGVCFLSAMLVHTWNRATNGPDFHWQPPQIFYD